MRRLAQLTVLLLSSQPSGSWCHRTSLNHANLVVHAHVHTVTFRRKIVRHARLWEVFAVLPERETKQGLEKS